MRKTLMSSVAAATLGFSLALAPGAIAADADTQAQTQVEAGQTDAEVTATNSINAEELIGEDVYSIDGEDIGDISTLMVGSDGQIRNVIVSFGGFLGMGEKEVALPWDRFTVGPEGEQITVDVTEAEIEAMPDFDWPEEYETGTLLRDDTVMDTSDELAADAEQVGEDVADTTENAAEEVEETAEEVADTAERTAEEVDQEIDEAVTTDAEVNTSVNQVAASTLIGTDIRTRDDEDVGEVNDVVLNGEGQIEGVLVDVGGFLGIDEKQVMLSWNELELMRDENEDLMIRVGLDAAAIESMPEYDAEIVQ